MSCLSYAALLLGMGRSARAAAQYDVLIHAATPGGVMASVASAREGRSVVLLEPGVYIGGAMSGGLSLVDYGMHAARTLGGLAEEFFRRVAARYSVPFAFPAEGQCGAHFVPWTCEPHVAEEVFANLLREAGVTVLTGARVVSARREGASPPRIASVTTADGREFGATVVIDGSYEGAQAERCCLVCHSACHPPSCGRRAAQARRRELHVGA
jgi:flavin-dependent dehydrogenase